MDNLTSAARLTWFALCTFARWESGFSSGVCWPSLTNGLKKQTGLARNTLRKALAELTLVGLVIVRKDYKGGKIARTNYTLIPEPGSVDKNLDGTSIQLSSEQSLEDEYTNLCPKNCEGEFVGSPTDPTRDSEIDMSSQKGHPLTQEGSPTDPLAGGDGSKAEPSLGQPLTPNRIYNRPIKNNRINEQANNQNRESETEIKNKNEIGQTNQLADRPLRRDDILKLFGIFWEDYPQRTAEADAQKVFFKIIPVGTMLKEGIRLCEEIQDKLIECAALEGWEDRETRYIPRFGNWLRKNYVSAW